MIFGWFFGDGLLRFLVCAIPVVSYIIKRGRVQLKEKKQLDFY